MSGVTCDERFGVIPTSLGPSRSSAIFGRSPAARSRVALVWRRPWKRIGGPPAAATSLRDLPIRLLTGKFANGAIGSVPTSVVTVGNSPGIEVRLYGSKGAIITRPVQQFGSPETIKAATSDAVAFKEPGVPARFYPAGGNARKEWRTLYYANPIKNVLDELTTGTAENQGGFDDGAWVREVTPHRRLTLTEAAAFSEREAGMPPAAARGEAVKNATFPGAAMMYPIGTDAMRDLRRRLAAIEGASFSPRTFHDRFLGYGAIPVSLIATAMAGGRERTGSPA